MHTQVWIYKTSFPYIILLSASFLSILPQLTKKLSGLVQRLVLSSYKLQLWARSELIMFGFFNPDFVQESRLRNPMGLLLSPPSRFFSSLKLRWMTVSTNLVRNLLNTKITPSEFPRQLNQGSWCSANKPARSNLNQQTRKRGFWLLPSQGWATCLIITNNRNGESWKVSYNI